MGINGQWQELAQPRQLSRCSSEPHSSRVTALSRRKLAFYNLVGNMLQLPSHPFRTQKSKCGAEENHGCAEEGQPAVTYLGVVGTGENVHYSNHPATRGLETGSAEQDRPGTGTE